MGLADELAKDDELLAFTAYQRCGVGLLWDALEEKDREALAVILGNPEWRGTKIVEFFRRTAESEEEGRVRSLYSTISSGTVQRHRRGACTCGGLS